MMGKWARLTRPPNMRLRLRVLAVGWLIIGAIGACGTGLKLAPAWQAAHGGGVTGTFTLTEPDGCDRYEPPRQRCGWWGDFRSDDGKTVRRDVYLVGELPPGARVGDTVLARDTGNPTGVYPLNDSQSWRSEAGAFAAFFGVFLVGVVVLEPWSWRNRLRSRGPRRDAPG
jgi:hypothetical protein